MQRTNWPLLGLLSASPICCYSLSIHLASSSLACEQTIFAMSTTWCLHSVLYIEAKEGHASSLTFWRAFFLLLFPSSSSSSFEVKVAFSSLFANCRLKWHCSCCFYHSYDFYTQLRVVSFFQIISKQSRLIWKENMKLLSFDPSFFSPLSHNSK